MYSMDNRPAPDFSLPDQDGVVRSLADYRGNWLVLYFYPQDNTPECTEEACAFRDEHLIISQFGNAEVVGVSKDSVASHKAFSKAHHLNFSLLSDETMQTVRTYGAWDPKSFAETERRTVIIDPTGMIVETFTKVTPTGHAHTIIESLQKLQGFTIQA